MNLFLDEIEVAERWGVSPRTLQGWRYRDKGKPIQLMTGAPWVLVGGAVRYRREDILAFEERNTCGKLFK